MGKLVAVIALALAGCWADFPYDRFSKHADAAPADLFIINYEALPNYEPRARREARLPDAPPPDRRADKPVPDQAPGDLRKCVPNGQVSCTADGKGINKCSPSGWGTVVVDCTPYQCLATLIRCNGCQVGGTYPACDTPKQNVIKSCSTDGLPTLTNCPKGCNSTTNACNP